ncbi:MAG: hypothetical protein BWY09_02994 [Candidatus Hydrogenedentes bacterium ADurb.Bin179]|nr:MAG: hypothetical protein BWY09_02994 [Candidatus Hydrogenedentes bacterium ADurb.Bin179]
MFSIGNGEITVPPPAALAAEWSDEGNLLTPQKVLKRHFYGWRGLPVKIKFDNTTVIWIGGPEPYYRAGAFRVHQHIFHFPIDLFFPEVFAPVPIGKPVFLCENGGVCGPPVITCELVCCVVFLRSGQAFQVGHFIQQPVQIDGRFPMCLRQRE